jgi:hypothetical protein
MCQVVVSSISRRERHRERLAVRLRYRVAVGAADDHDQDHRQTERPLGLSLAMQQGTCHSLSCPAFGQLAGLMDQQADRLERAGTLMRDLLTAGGLSRRENLVSWSSPWWLVVRENGWSGLGRRFESVANCGVVAARSLRCAGVGRMIVVA